MPFSDDQIRNEAKVLEGMLEKHDYTGLHNRLVSDSNLTNKDEFNKLVGMMNDMNKSAREGNSQLPALEIHNDGFLGFGKTDQIVLKDTNSGRKMEIYENGQHRQNEIAEQNNQAKPYQLDPLRQMEKASNKWVGAPDFQQDSSVTWQQNKVESSPAYYVTDHRNHNTGNSYNAANDVQQRVNNGEYLQSTSQYKYERRR